MDQFGNVIPFTYEEVTEQLVEARAINEALVLPDRAGWGDEPRITCLYCGAYDYKTAEDEYPYNGEHHPDCDILRARRWLNGGSSAD